MTRPPLHQLERVDSTQDVLHELAAAGAPAGTAVAAGEQVAGRGRRGRRWSSPPGGAWLSVLYRPSSSTAAELLALRVGLATAAVVEALVGRAVSVKWPNDLMLGDAKAGGVLCEARWQGELPAWVVAGVGINVRNVPPADVRLPATRLADWAPALQVHDVVASLVESLRGVEPLGARLSDSDLAAFAARDWLRGRPLLEPSAGTAAGLDASGALLVRAPDGTIHRVRAGTVVTAGPEAGLLKG